MKALAYLRVSRAEQVDGVSLEAQEAAVRAYCTLRGLDLVDILVDPGVSAGTPLADRPVGGELVAALERGDGQAVVATKLDRLFRDAVDCLEMTRRWDGQGASLHLIDLGGQAIDTSSAIGRFFLTVMAGAAEMERTLIRERIQGALDHKRAKGERIGHIPFGCTVAADGVLLEVEDVEVLTVERMRALRSDGFSVRRTAVALNGEGLLNRGRPWTKSAVDRIARRAA